MRRVMWLAKAILWALGGLELIQEHVEIQRATEAGPAPAPPARPMPGPLPEDPSTASAAVGPIEHDHQVDDERGLHHAHAFGDQAHDHPDGYDEDPEFLEDRA